MVDKLYSFEDHPEHEARLPEWRDMWIANALSTESTENVRGEVVEAIQGLYRAAELDVPAADRIVFVRSPHVAAVVGTIAGAVLDRGASPVLLASGELAIREGMTKAEAPLDAISDAVVAYWQAVGVSGATAAADPAEVPSLLQATANWWQMHNGGSDWSGWVAYLSFFDEVAQLDLPIYETKWRPYAKAARLSASRVMHEQFCIVSDRQCEIHVEMVGGRGRLHREGGPARRWADGFELHFWHGTEVPADFWGWDVARVMAERNDEVRRAGIERIGWHEFLAGLPVLATTDDPGNPEQVLTLFDLDNEAGKRLIGAGEGDDEWEEIPRLIVMDNASVDPGGHRRRYSRLVPASVSDPVEGIAQSYGLSRDEYVLMDAAR